MKFSLNQQDLQKSLNYCQGVIEKRSTLPILSNVLLDVSNGKLTMTATDLDLIFIHQIPNVEIFLLTLLGHGTNPEVHAFQSYQFPVPDASKGCTFDEF